VVAVSLGITNAQEGYDQTPMSQWAVSDDEEDSVPISQLLVADKVKVTGHRKDNAESERGHGNLGRDVAKFFETVCYVGHVTEVIPRRKGFYYKITYEDGDQEDMDEDEFIHALQLKHKKDRGEEISNDAEVLSGLSEEGSVYDSEEDNKALKEAKRKRKAVAQMESSEKKKKERPEKNGLSVRNRWLTLGGPIQCLANQCPGTFNCSVAFIVLFILSSRYSMDEAELATVCLLVAKPVKKVVRKTFEEAVLLVSCLSVICMCCSNIY
jgi:hypothetical protein